MEKRSKADAMFIFVSNPMLMRTRYREEGEWSRGSMVYVSDSFDYKAWCERTKATHIGLMCNINVDNLSILLNTLKLKSLYVDVNCQFNTEQIDIINDENSKHVTFLDISRWNKNVEKMLNKFSHVKKLVLNNIENSTYDKYTSNMTYLHDLSIRGSITHEDMLKNLANKNKSLKVLDISFNTDEIKDDEGKPILERSFTFHDVSTLLQALELQSINISDNKFTRVECIDLWIQGNKKNKTFTIKNTTNMVNVFEYVYAVCSKCNEKKKMKVNITKPAVCTDCTCFIGMASNSGSATDIWLVKDKTTKTNQVYKIFIGDETPEIDNLEHQPEFEYESWVYSIIDEKVKGSTSRHFVKHITQHENLSFDGLRDMFMEYTDMNKEDKNVVSAASNMILSITCYMTNKMRNNRKKRPSILDIDQKQFSIGGMYHDVWTNLNDARDRLRYEITVTEDGGEQNLKMFLIENKKNDIRILHVLIQLLIALNELTKIECAHNDLHLGNVLVKSNDSESTNKYTYTVDKKEYTFNLNSNDCVLLYDWNRAYTKELEDNPINNKYNKDICVKYSSCNEFVPQRDMLRVFMCTYQYISEDIKNKLLDCLWKNNEKKEDKISWIKNYVKVQPKYRCYLKNKETHMIMGKEYITTNFNHPSVVLHNLLIYSKIDIMHTSPSSDNIHTNLTLT